MADTAGIASKISIHAPREGSDEICYYINHFYKISIHAPREGSDELVNLASGANINFNPRSPRGERQQYCTDIHDPNGNIATRLPNEACLRDEKHCFEPKKVI